MGIFRPGPECRRQERSFAETWPHNHSGGAAVCFSQASEEKNSTLLNLSGEHMGPEHATREKKITMVNFLIFVQKN